MPIVCHGKVSNLKRVGSVRNNIYERTHDHWTVDGVGSDSEIYEYRKSASATVTTK
mgnify:CR=1 FL=1